MKRNSFLPNQQIKRFFLFGIISFLYNVHYTNATKQHIRSQYGDTTHLQHAHYSDGILLPDDYGSPTVEISGSVFDLRKGWMAPTTSDDFPEMGAWITPKAAGLSLLISFMFEINSKALKANYAKTIKTFIEISNQNLPKNVGQLFEVTYNYSAFETVDVNSVRFKTKGVGMSPEQSLANAPIDEISSKYEGTRDYAFSNKHYVWIFKNNKGNLVLSTIREPFLNNLEQKALAIKIESLKQDSIPLSFKSDVDISIYNDATQWIEQTKKLKSQLTEANRINYINQLNNEYLEKQNQFNDLYKKYQEMKSKSNEINALQRGIAICQDITELFNNKFIKSQTSEESLYKFQQEYIDESLRKISEQRQGIAKDLVDTKSKLKKAFLDSHLPPPPPRILPLF